MALVIARICEPSSDLSIAENFSRKTALSDLLGVSEGKVYDNRLYRANTRKSCSTNWACTCPHN